MCKKDRRITKHSGETHEELGDDATGWMDNAADEHIVAAGARQRLVLRGLACRMGRQGTATVTAARPQAFSFEELRSCEAVAR